MIKKVLLFLLVVLVAIQFIPSSVENKPLDNNSDLLVVTNASTEVSAILKRSCYDCHSSMSKDYWYKGIAPFSWWIAHHIEEGREELNFSEWTSYPKEKQIHKLEEIIEEIEEGEMPLSSYTLMHKGTEVTAEELALLKAWIAPMIEKH